jgi:hypothetical protein
LSRVKDECIEITGVHYARYGWIFTAQPTGYDTVLEDFVNSKSGLVLRKQIFCDVSAYGGVISFEGIQRPYAVHLQGYESMN